MNEPTVLRIVIIVLVALSAWLWPRDMRRNWTVWTRRARRVTMAILPVLVANGWALVLAIRHDVPIRSSTIGLLISFVILNGALLFHPRNDYTTDRQYADWFRRLHLR